MCIGFGGVAYLSSGSSVVGAIIFTVGLFVICSFGLSLYTGKVGYILQKDAEYFVKIPVIWIGNIFGAWLTAFLVKLTRVSGITEKAVQVCEVKLNDSLLSLFVLGVLCNIFIYIAVEGFRIIDSSIGKYLALFFGVCVFILCGYEHSIADMFYFSMAGIGGKRMLLCLVVISLGNAVGGIAANSLLSLKGE